MKKRDKRVPRPLSAEMQDTYTRSELLAICEGELFTKVKRMDTALLQEALYALDERPDEEAAPHRSLVWSKIIARIHIPVRVPKRRPALILVLILLLLALVGGGLAWAFHLGVLSIPTAVMTQYDSPESEAAQSLVQTDLFTAQYNHSELRVREAAFDGQQLRIVYSLRDTREDASLTDSDSYMASIAAAQLDGIGGCDYLIVDGRDDVYLDDIFQLPGENPAEMLYYIAANIPGDMLLSDVITVQMPIGAFDLETRTRLHDDVIFTLDTTQATQYTLFAKPATVVWDTLEVAVTDAHFSPLRGLVAVEYRAVDAAPSCTPIELRLFTPSGNPVGQPRPSAFGSPNGLNVTVIITQYIPTGDWPEQMVLAPELPGGGMDTNHIIPLTWQSKK